MAACTLVAGDCIYVTVTGDNGVTKTRPCVVMEVVPPGQPKLVMFMFGCSDTKPAYVNTPNFFRVTTDAESFDLMSLSNDTSFHVDDVRGILATSPQLKKRGRCGRTEFNELKRVYQAYKAAGLPIRVEPPNAPANLADMIRVHLAGSSKTAPVPTISAQPQPLISRTVTPVEPPDGSGQ
jgi:hypothetical protein